MVKTRKIIYSQFIDLDLANDVAIFISDTQNDVLVSFCSFSSITSNLENACLSLAANTCNASSLCFLLIRCVHNADEACGGSCLSQFDTKNIELSEFSLFDTNTNEYYIHSSIYIEDSEGSVKRVNQSKTKCISQRNCCRGICFKKQIDCTLSDCVFENCEGGSSVYFEYMRGNANCQKIVFRNIIPKEGYLIDDFGSSGTYSFSSCVCIGCNVNYISSKQFQMSGWYIDQKPPGYLIKTVTSTKSIYPEIEVFCKYEKLLSTEQKTDYLYRFVLGFSCLGIINFPCQKASKIKKSSKRFI